MSRVEPSTNFSHRRHDPTWDRFSRGIFTLAVIVLAAGVLAPGKASAHAGEVHPDGPKAGVAASKQGGIEARSNAGASKTGSRREDVPRSEGKGRPGEEEQPVGATSKSPPPPDKPDSDPLIHFAALGVVAVAGLGLLMVRRRRLEA